MVPFDIPVTFTIAPHDPDIDEEGFKRYASRMNGLSEGEFYTILTGESCTPRTVGCLQIASATLFREGAQCSQSMQSE